jgi:hypothetical protein
MAALLSRSNAGTTFLPASLILELPLLDTSYLLSSNRSSSRDFPDISLALPSTTIWPRRAGSRLDSVSQAAEGVEDLTIVDGAWKAVKYGDMLFVFVRSVPFPIAHPLYTVYSSASLLLASNPFHAFFHIGVAYTLSFSNFVAL